jgi:cyclase
MMRLKVIPAMTALLLCQRALAEDEVGMNLQKVSGDVWCLVGQGGNMGILSTGDGLLVVDSKYGSLAEEVLQRIRTISREPIRYLINTHHHADHTGGNEIVGAGCEIIMHPACRASLEDLFEQAGVSPGYMARVTDWTDGMMLRLGGEAVRLLHYGNAHTAGDLVVVFEKSKVVHAGDLFFNGWPPYIDVESGSDTDNWVRSIERLCSRYPDYAFIPGHGEVADAESFLELAAYLRYLRKEVAAAIAGGKTREQAIETVDLRAYSHLKDPRAGGGLTTKRNVGWVYDEMTRGKSHE